MTPTPKLRALAEKATKLTKAERAFLTELSIQPRSWHSINNAAYRMAVRLKDKGLITTEFKSFVAREYAVISPAGLAALQEPKP